MRLTLLLKHPALPSLSSALKSLALGSSALANPHTSHRQLRSSDQPESLPAPQNLHILYHLHLLPNLKTPLTLRHCPPAPESLPPQTIPPTPHRAPPLRPNLPALLLTLLLAAPTFAQVPIVETDIPPVNALVAQVMGTLGTPTMLLDKGGDEHDMQLRPSQMRDLNAATLLVWVGPDLTPGVDRARQSAPNLQSLSLLDKPATLRLDYTAGGLNPHAWLDPANATVWIGLIEDRLAQLDPANAATYHANADQARDRLITLDATLAAKLAPLNRPFVTYHDAYSYFATHFHLPYAGGLAAGDAAPPGAARLSDLHAQATLGTIACAFPEAQHDPALITNMAVGTTLFIGPALDPTGSTLAPGPDAYDTLLTNLAEALLTCAAANP